MGGVTVTAGIFGVVIGGTLGDFASRYTQQAYFFVSGLSIGIAAFFAAYVTAVPSFHMVSPRFSH